MLAWILKLAHIGGPHEEVKKKVIPTTIQHKEGTDEHVSLGKAALLRLICSAKRR